MRLTSVSTIIIGGTYRLQERMRSSQFFTFKVLNIDFMSLVCQYDLRRRYVVSEYSEKNPR